MATGFEYVNDIHTTARKLTQYATDDAVIRNYRFHNI